MDFHARGLSSGLCFFLFLLPILMEARLNNFKQLICLTITLCIIFLPTTGYSVPAGYTKYKILTLTGSSTGSVSGYDKSIIISPFSNPIETGEWSINSKNYNFRLGIEITQTAAMALTDYPCSIELNMLWLSNNGYLNSATSCNKIEFCIDSDTTGLPYYNCDSSARLRHQYFVKLSLAASTGYILYVYFDPDISAISSNSMGIGDILETKYIEEQVSASTDDAYTFAPSTINTTGNLTYVGNSSAVLNSGYRFTTVDFPNNSSAQSVFQFGVCNLLVYSYGAGNVGSDVKTKIYGEYPADFDSDTFSTFADFSGRTKTTSNITWNIAETWAGGWHTSPDISNIIKEIVGKFGVSGWAANNNLSIFWVDNSSANNNFIALWSYNGNSAIAPKLQITAYMHPDYSLLPLINIPRLQDVDVYLNNESINFPFDVQFTSANGTQLYFGDKPETRRTGRNEAMEFVVHVTDEIPQSGSVDIKIFAGNSSQTTWSAYHVNTTAAVFQDEFLTTGAFTSVSGTWSSADQQVPIYKGGKNAFTRPMIPTLKDGKIHLWSNDGDYWTGLSTLFHLMPLHFWRYPAKTVYSDTTDFTWINTYGAKLYPVTPSPIAEEPWPGYATSISTADNITYYMTYLSSDNGKGCVLLLQSTNLSDWTMCNNGDPIWTVGDDSSPDLSEGMEPCLFWDASNNRWILYLSYFTTPYVCAATLSGTNPVGTYSYNGVAYTPYDYIENAFVIKEGSTYYMFFREDRDVYDSTTPTYISYVTSSNPLSGWGPTNHPTAITMTHYDWDWDTPAMPKLWKDSEGVWNMLHVGHPENSVGTGILSGNIDNQIGWAKASSFPGTWTPQNVEKMAYLSSTGARDVMVVTGGNYSNVQITAPILLRYTMENAGIVFRYQDSSNYYYCVFDRSENALKLYKYVSGSATLLQSASLGFTMNPSGTTYPLIVKCYGNNIKCYASQYNDQFNKIIDTSDSSLSSTGNIGLIGLASTFYCERLLVTDYIEPEITITDNGFRSISNQVIMIY